MKPRVTTRTYAKSLARSGPELQPNQIRLADEAQIDKAKVFTQSDVNNGMSGGGGGPSHDPIDLDGYVTTEELSQEAAARETGDKANLGLIEANKKGIAAINKDYTTTEEFNTLNGTVSQNKKDIASLGDAFDTAVLAAQEGADKLEIELQSYAKKEDLPEGVNLEGYAKTDYVDSADQALNALIAANTQAIEDIDIPDAPEYKTPSLDEVCKAGYVTNSTIGCKGISTTDTFDARGKYNGVEYAHFYGSDSKSDLKVQDNEVTVGDNTRDAGATLKVIGSVNATEFVGDGSKLTGLPSPTYIDWNNLPNLTV